MNCMLECVINEHHEEWIDCISYQDKVKAGENIKATKIAHTSQTKGKPMTAWEKEVLSKVGI